MVKTISRKVQYIVFGMQNGRAEEDIDNHANGQNACHANCAAQSADHCPKDYESIT